MLFSGFDSLFPVSLYTLLILCNISKVIGKYIKTHWKVRKAAACYGSMTISISQRSSMRLCMTIVSMCLCRALHSEGVKLCYITSTETDNSRLAGWSGLKYVFLLGCFHMRTFSRVGIIHIVSLEELSLSLPLSHFSLNGSFSFWPQMICSPFTGSTEEKNWCVCQSCVLFECGC